MRTIQDITYLVIWLSRKSVVILFLLFQFLIFTQPHDGNVTLRALYKSIENMLGDIFYDNIWNMGNFFFATFFYNFVADSLKKKSRRESHVWSKEFLPIWTSSTLRHIQTIIYIESSFIFLMNRFLSINWNWSDKKK